jgi:hypothetical protein
MIADSSRARRDLSRKSMPHLRDMRLHLLMDHWLDRRGGNGVPLRSAIDPSAIVSMLPYIWLCEYNGAEGRFRMRLAGEEINKLYGRNISNCYFEEIASPSFLPVMMRRYRRIIEQPAILHCAGLIYFSNSSPVVGERLGLPLRMGDGRITQIIGVSMYDFPLEQYDFGVQGEEMTEIYTPILE